MHTAVTLEIDHKDGDALNNRIENLREVTRKVNLQNKRKAKNNTSSITGVKRSGKKWIAQGKDDGNYIYLGTFEDQQDAFEARLDWNLAQPGFTFTHGVR